MSILEGIGLQFDEAMSGYLGVGESDPRAGAEVGKRNRYALRFDVQIRITDLNRFLKISDHDAELSGTITFEPLGGTFPIRDGRFNLFSLDPETGMRQMLYGFKFTARDGQTYFLHGQKEVHDDPGRIDVVEDLTRLFTTIYRGDDDQAPIYGAGELYFKLVDIPSLLASMEVTGEPSWRQRVAAYIAFASFAYGALRDEYLKGLRLTYDTGYENLVLSGVVQTDDGPRPFFLVSGVHDKHFPWGDGETFWDVLLAVGGADGGYWRYCISDRVLEGLDLDVEHGTYRYRGPLFALKEGYDASFSDMRAGDPRLMKCQAELEIDFEAQPCNTVSFPFPVERGWRRKLSRVSASLAEAFREQLPSEIPLGMYITPHTLAVRSGRLSVQIPNKSSDAPAEPDELLVDIDETFGEAERATFRNIKEPTLLYGYICGVRPKARVNRVQIHTSTLRDEREHWVKDQLDAFLGTIVQRVSSGEYLLREGGRLDKRDLDRQGEEAAKGNLFVKLGDPIIEVNNDHYPTAVFQRKIVKVRDPSGEECFALEEDMRLMRLEAVNSDRQVTVAAIRNDQSKLAALDKVLDATGFDSVVEGSLSQTGKNRSDFSIVVKPNFMFAYNKVDHSTYTDPDLVGHLVTRLRSGGFEKIAVVEAQSTYGEYFDKRSVREMAEYLGFDTAVDCEIVDLTLDEFQEQDFGPHLGRHRIPVTWRDADFRISFAKNKTHAYAYYTLTLKNIYGALPLANKFKEYHCNRDIYHTTIEYLTAFPVHFGLVDAYLSADGPFGIFADTKPNQTKTIIGGADLVAVDWVAATKMGIDPMISKYMRLAVDKFGKPEIEFIGDESLYRPWLNVPVALSLFTHKGLDADYHFGNLIYSCCAHMDEEHFRHKDNRRRIALLRRLTKPIRYTFFVRTAKDPTLLNRVASWLLYRMGH